MVTRYEIFRAVRDAGVCEGDICLFHSSYRSLGGVIGGAQAVIDGFEDALGRDGTLAVPTLSQVDFTNSYKTWNIDKPSDVGYLTEYFRKLPYVYRSDQATHSVAARGREAYWLTAMHTDHGPRLCPFGEYAFCDSSPWMKLYQRDAKIVFVGVTMRYHTMKHLLEGMYVEGLLGQISDPEKRERMKDRLLTFDKLWDGGIWPYYDGEMMQRELEADGLVRSAMCGPAKFLCVDAKASGDAALERLRGEPERWYSGKVLEWIRECGG